MSPPAARDLLKRLGQIVVGHAQIIERVSAGLAFAHIHIDGKHIAADLTSDHTDIVIFEPAIEPDRQRVFVGPLRLVVLPPCWRWVLARGRAILPLTARTAAIRQDVVNRNDTEALRCPPQSPI